MPVPRGDLGQGDPVQTSLWFATARSWERSPLCAELVKSCLIFPTKANWWENKETGLIFVFVFFCSTSPVPRADSPARFDDSLYTVPLQIARAAPEFHSPWSSSIELHQRAARALLVRHVQLESPATGGLMQIAYLGDTR